MAVSVLASYVWLVGSAVGADTPDPVPQANDVTAGWVAALVFGLLIVAVVLLARSFVKQLRKAQAAKDAGVYGDPPATGEEPPSGSSTPQRPDAASR